ncbi:MAG: BadF/BadG/BcrA/BcrD ATPase family protein, partial [[Clostridium] innocuum]
MKIYLGADLGGSATKLLLCDPHGKLLAETQCPLIRTSAALTAAVHAFLKTQGRDEEEVESMAMTGVGSSFIEGPVIGKEPLKIDEMQAVGQGAQALSCQQDILAVSMGTGTALIRADHARIRHIGGTGVGGGTLAGLALRLTGMETADFIQLSLSG